MAHFTNDATLIDLEPDYKRYGQVSKLIFESFFKFVKRVEQTGKRTAEQWAQIQDETGENAFTGLLTWTTDLASKAVYHSCYD